MGDTGDRFEFDEDSLDFHIRENIPADTAAISPVVERIMCYVKKFPAISGKEFEIETAIREALANAIVHGAKGDTDKQVEVSVGFEEDLGMMIVVRDPGPGFDPGGVPSPIRGQQIHRSHGRGIFLINELMDEVEYRRGGTEIWMRKR